MIGTSSRAEEGEENTEKWNKRTNHDEGEKMMGMDREKKGKR